MKNSIIIVLFLLYTSIVNAQAIDSIDINRIAILEQQNTVLRKQLTKLAQRTQELATQVSSNSEKVNLLGEAVEQKVGGLREQMDSIDESYGLRMTNTETVVQATDTRQHKSVVWGIVTASVLCLLLVAAYFILRKRIAKKGDDIELLRARADDLNRQMVERMDKEFAELQKIAESANVPATATGNNNAEPDHSLVTALAYGITRIEYNLHSMSPDVKGYKQLQIALRKMKDNLRANNYEIVDMLGKEYDEGMTLSNVTFKADSNLEDGKQMITRVIHPQINYKGRAIQFADIEVSRNE